MRPKLPSRSKFVIPNEGTNENYKKFHKYIIILWKSSLCLAQLPNIRDNSGNAELSTRSRAQFAMRWVSGVERSRGCTRFTPGRAYRPIALVTAR